MAFLGGTIGNFYQEERTAFLGALADVLEPGDWLALGVDLVKPLDRLMAAYDDSQGITDAFIRNSLSVINREFDGDFDIGNFDYVPLWDGREHRIDMRLRTLEPERVRLGSLGLTIDLDAGEELRVEISTKFERAALLDELVDAGFEPGDFLTDAAGDFGLAVVRRGGLTATPAPAARAGRRAPRPRRAPRAAARSSRARPPPRRGSPPRSGSFVDVVEVVLAERTPPPAQNGSRSPARTAGGSPARRCRACVEPRPARRARGKRRSGTPCTGIVDHRFDHIDSGKLSPPGPRAYLRVPSVTCTQLPYTPPIAHSRIDVGVAGEQRHERPAVGAVLGVDAEHVGERGVEVDGGRQRVARRRRRRRPASGRAAACGRAARTAGRPACPRCRRPLVVAEVVAVVGAHDDRGVSHSCCASSASSTSPNQWSIIDSLAP